MASPWVVIRSDDDGLTVVCQRCATEQPIALPASPSLVAVIIEAFVADHRKCREPVDSGVEV